MFVEIKTPFFGYSYFLSPDFCDKLPEDTDGRSHQFWVRTNGVITSSIVLPFFVSFVVFCMLAILGKTSWYMTAIYPLVAMFVASFFTKWLWLIKATMFITFIYGVLYKILIPTIIVFILSVFVVHNWLAAVVYIAGMFIVNLIISTFNGAYQHIKFNERVACMVYEELYGESLE